MNAVQEQGGARGGIFRAGVAVGVGGMLEGERTFGAGFLDGDKDDVPCEALCR